MGSVPFAFSVHHFINSVGADAGFAAIIGLAILILLYFAQARETATLRDHAYEAAQRIQQLEGRIAGLARQGPTPAPAVARDPVTASAPNASPAPPAPVPAGVPAPAFLGAPAGVGAPALSAATRLIPGGAGTRAPEPVPAAAPASTATPAATPAATPVSTPATPAPGAIPAPAAPAFQPATAAARGPAVAAAARPSGGTAVLEPDATTIGELGSGDDRELPPAGNGGNRTLPPAPAPPRVQIRPGAAAARRPVLPPPGPDRSSSILPRVLLALLGVLALGAVVAVLLVLTSSSGNSHSSSQASQTSNAPVPHRPRRPAPSFRPASVTVAVLNGTAVSNLAHRVAQKLAAAGYRQGTIATAADQTHTATSVAFLPGHRSDAEHVASTLKLPGSAVVAIDSATQAVACPPPGSCGVTVVVTVGSDLSATA